MYKDQMCLVIVLVRGRSSKIKAMTGLGVRGYTSLHAPWRKEGKMVKCCVKPLIKGHYDTNEGVPFVV